MILFKNGADAGPQETPTGSIETVEGFEPAFKATVGFGADWLSFDPDGQHARIDLKAVARTEDGHSISFGYVGVITLDDDLRKIFTASPDAKTIPFGNASAFNVSITSCLVAFCNSLVVLTC